MESLKLFLEDNFQLTPWGLVWQTLSKEAVPHTRWLLSHSDCDFSIEIKVQYGSARYGTVEGIATVKWQTTSNHLCEFRFQRYGKRPWSLETIKLGKDKSKNFYPTITEWAKAHKVPVEYV